MGDTEALLLRNLSKEGGAGFVSLVSLAEAGDKQAAEEIHDMAWEQLHSGPWHAVAAVWRDAYSLSSLFLAACFEREGNLEKSLKCLDVGLIMGGLQFRARLENAIASIQNILKNPRVKDPDIFGSRPPACHSADTRDDDFQKVSLAESDGILLCNDSSTGGLEVAEPPQQKAVKKRKDRSGPAELPEGDDLKGLLDVNNFKSKSYAEAEVLKALPPGSLCQAGIEKRCLPSLETFARDFFLPGTPVVIKSGMSHWPAMIKWKDPDYLSKLAGNRTVPVEIGEHYLAAEWKQLLMTMGQLLEQSCSFDAPSASRPYLAQHALFDQDCRSLN